MKKIKYLCINIESWKSDLVLFVGNRDLLPRELKKMTSENKFNDFKKMFEDKISLTTEGQMFPMGGGGSVIWLKYPDLNILIHELMHSVHYLLNIKGIRLDDCTQEAYCYLIEFLYKKTSKWLKLK